MDLGYKIKDIMIKDVVSVDQDKSITSCAQLMKNKKIGCLIILKNKKVVGLITEQDLTRRVLAKKLNPDKTKVKQIMSKNIQAVEPESMVSKAVEIMKKADIEHLPVVHKERLKGIVSSNNIIKRMYADRYFLLSRKKAFLIASIWVLAVALHNILSTVLGQREIFFFLVSAVIIPIYFLITLIYTIFRNKITKRKNNKI